MKPGRKDMPQIIVLGVLVAAVLGYITFTLTSGGGASKKPANSKKQASTNAAKPGELDTMPAEYAGRYTGRYIVSDEQSREWAGKANIAVDHTGVVTGYVWLPTSGGGPGLVSVVSGKVEPSGILSLRSDKAATGGADGALQGTPVEKFQFRHTGRIESKQGKLSIIASGKGNQGFEERLTATKSGQSQQTAQVAAEPASMVAATSGRDPFAPCLVAENYRQQRQPVRITRPLAKLPTFSPSTSNVALGIRPLPPVPDVAIQEAREPDPNFVLTGVIVGPSSVAIVRAGSERYIVREGQSINGKYFVRSISRDQVVLRNKHNNIYLKLGGSANAS